MPTTVVERASRIYSDTDYPGRLRRPAYLEGLGFTPVIYRPPPDASVPTTMVPPPTYVPSTYQEPKTELAPDVELQPSAPVTPPPSVVQPKTSPWVWVAGGGASLVVFWLLFRRKRKG